MESTLPKTALVAAMTSSKAMTIFYWIFTALFCLQMGFTAYYELLRLPEAAQAFSRLGFSASSFRIELSWAKVAGVIALLVPKVPPRLREWAYAGFAINLVSALIAHLSVGDGPEARNYAAGAGLLWGVSYFFYRSLKAAQENA